VQKVIDLCLIILLFVGSCSGAGSADDLRDPFLSRSATQAHPWSRDELYKQLDPSEPRDGARQAVWNVARTAVQSSLIDPSKSRDDYKNRKPQELEGSVTALAVAVAFGKATLDSQDQGILGVIEEECTHLQRLLDKQSTCCACCWTCFCPKNLLYVALTAAVGVILLQKFCPRVFSYFRAVA